MQSFIDSVACGTVELIGRLPMPPSYQTGSQIGIQVCILLMDIILLFTVQNHEAVVLCVFQLYGLIFHFYLVD